MTRRRVYLLHLLPSALRWVAVERRGADWILAERGERPGEPVRALEAWFAEARPLRGSLRIFDGRPRFYTFGLTVPATARKQIPDILKLRMRQELGLGEASAALGVSSWSEADDEGRLGLLAAVARREGLDDLRPLGEALAPEPLWIASDVQAVHALSRKAGLPAGTVVLNADASGVTAFEFDAEGRVLKRRIAAPAEHSSAEIEPEGSASSGRLTFGAQSDVGEGPWAGALGALPERELALTNGRRPFHVPSAVAELGRFDAVLLGGLLSLADADLRMESLIPDERPRWARLPWLSRVSPATALIWAAASLALLGLSVWGVAGIRDRARERLVAEAQALTPRTTLLQSQERVLRRIRAERAPVIPLIRALHEAAPQGLQLNTLKLSENGTFQIDGTAGSQEAPTRFFRTIAESPLFERVHLQDVKGGGPRGREFTFQLTAQIKGRSRRS